MAATSVSSAPIPSGGNSTFGIESSVGKSSRQSDVTDNAFGVDETTFFAGASEGPARQADRVAAVDAALEEPDLDSLGDELVEELATGLP